MPDDTGCTTVSSHRTADATLATGDPRSPQIGHICTLIFLVRQVPQPPLGFPQYTMTYEVEISQEETACVRGQKTWEVETASFSLAASPQAYRSI